MRPKSKRDGTENTQSGIGAGKPNLRGLAIERLVGLCTGVGIVGVVLFLVVDDRPLSNPNVVVALRIVLSLAVGILGATIPGFLNVRYGVRGLVVRASGALGLFVLTFFFTPTVYPVTPPEPTIELDAIRQIDFRTSVAPGESDSVRAEGMTYATVPVSIRSTKEPATRASLDGTLIAFRDNAGTEHEFQWRNFVTMHEERFGVWLGIDGDATPVSIPAGDTLFREVLHQPTKAYTWKQFVDFVTAPGGDSLDVQVSALVEKQRLTQNCRVDLDRWRTAVTEFQQKNGILPGRVTMDCRR